ncbi:MAG: TolC family protein [Bacteroidetes bacterium]|nr:TolC family protein [Bacteroidota bacterium]
MHPIYLFVTISNSITISGSITICPALSGLGRKKKGPRPFPGLTRLRSASRNFAAVLPWAATGRAFSANIDCDGDLGRELDCDGDLGRELDCDGDLGRELDCDGDLDERLEGIPVSFVLIFCNLPLPNHYELSGSKGMYRWLTLLLLTPFFILTAHAQELRMEELLSSVNDNHPRIRAAMAEIDLQRGRKLQAIAPPSPQFTFHEEEIPKGAALGDGNQRIWQVSQGFDIPLLIGARGYAYGHLQQAAEHRLAFARAMVRAEIIRTYTAWFAAQRQLRLQEENLRLAGDFARKARLRNESGETSALEAARARAEEATARIALEAARRGLQDAAAALSQAAALSTVPVSWSGTDIGPPPADSLELQRASRTLRLPEVPGATTSSPLLDAMREERDAARANASWRWMEFLPRFEAAWFRQDFKDIGAHWGAELTASLPLWFLLDTRGSIEEHAAAAQQADAQYEITMREFEHSVRIAQGALASAAANLQAYDGELLDEAERIARAAESGYDSGEISYMEYIAARQSANSISIGYYDALAALYAAVAQYELVTGNQILE